MDNKILNQYDIGIIINALISFRNSLLKEQRNTNSVEDVLTKMLNLSEKKKVTCKIIDAR